MKKIVLLMGLVVCLTACGNKDVNENILEDSSRNDEVVINLPNEEENIVSDETVSNKEENKDIEKPNEIVNNKEENKATDGLSETVNKKSEEVKTDSEPIYEDGVEVGKKAIDFEVELLSGEKVKLSDYLGKPVFLNFWATWCGPCVGEMPDIEKIQTEYGDKITVLAINGGELKDDVKAFIDKKGYTFNIGLNEKGDLLAKYDSMYIPLSVFIDENGIIKEKVVGALSEEKMLKIVKNLLNVE